MQVAGLKEDLETAKAEVALCDEREQLQQLEVGCVAAIVPLLRCPEPSQLPPPIVAGRSPDPASAPSSPGALLPLRSSSSSGSATSSRQTSTR